MGEIEIIQPLPSKPGVYRILNTETGDMYVGSSVNMLRRRNTHLWHLRRGDHQSPILTAAWEKYGESEFVFEVLEICEKSDLLTREQHYLDTLRPRYNIALVAGSPMKGRKQSPEFCQMISEHNRNLWLDPDFRERILSARRGRHHSEETKQKMSQSHKKRGKTLTPEQKQRLLDANLGRVVTEETRRRMSLAHTGLVHSEETRRKCSEAKLGKPRPPHVQQLLREHNARRSEEARRRREQAQKDGLMTDGNTAA